MSPREKAEELISKFLWPQRKHSEPAMGIVAIECAIIAVEEILSLTNLFDREFWEDVLTELK